MPISETFLEGNRRVYTASFKVPDEDGALTDPTTVTFYRRPIGSGTLDDLETYVYGVASEVAKLSTGVYTLTVDYPSDGRYVIGVEGAGVCTAYTELDVIVGNAKARP